MIDPLGEEEGHLNLRGGVEMAMGPFGHQWE